MGKRSEVLRRASLGGSAVAAITASLCCVGPLIAMALGGGGFAASELFEKWRPVFLIITVALLALAWYLTYKNPKGRCEDGAVCATKAVSKWKNVILSSTTALVLITVAFPSLSAAILRATKTNLHAPTGANTAVLKAKIPGMDCPACALSIQSVLKRQPGVRGAQVSFGSKEAVVQYDFTKISPEKIIAAIDQTGFKAEPAK